MALQRFLLAPFFPWILRDVLVLLRRSVGLRPIYKCYWYGGRNLVCSQFLFLNVLTFDTALISFWSTFIIWLVWISLCLSKIITWNLPGFTIMWLFLNQFIAISLSDSRILMRLSIVLAKLERVLSSPKLWAEATNIK